MSGSRPAGASAARSRNAKTPPATQCYVVGVPTENERSSLWRGPLRSPAFRRLWIGEAVSVAGTQLHFVALPWLVLEATGSGAALGSVLMTAALPRAALMLIGGAVTDRASPTALMIGSNLARAVFAGALASAVLADRVPLVLLYAIAALFGIADAIFYPAYAAIVPRLVSAGHLAAANSLLQGTAQIAGLFVPAAAGVAIAFAGLSAAFAADAVSFLFAAALLATIDAGRPTPPGRSTHTFAADIRSGLHYVRSRPHIRSLIAAVAVVNLAFVGPFVVGGAALARERFDGGVADFGWLLSALAGGALTGTLLAPAIERRGPSRGTLLAGGMMAMGASLISLGLTWHVVPACALVALAGFAAGCLNPSSCRGSSGRRRRECAGG
jgi:MFS family permease